MSFEYRSPEPRDSDLTKRILMTSFGLLLFVVATLSPTTSMVDNASGQGVQEEETTEEEENNTKLVRQFLSTLDAGNVSNISQFISPQYVNKPGLPVDPVKAQLRGPEAFTDEVNSVREGFPDIREEVQTIVTQGNMVVAITNNTGTNTSNFFTLPPTGNKASWEAVHIFRIGEDGKIAEHKVIRNLTFLVELGAAEPASPKYQPLFQALMKGLTNSSR